MANRIEIVIKSFATPARNEDGSVTTHCVMTQFEGKICSSALMFDCDSVNSVELFAEGIATGIQAAVGYRPDFVYLEE